MTFRRIQVWTGRPSLFRRHWVDACLFARASASPWRQRASSRRAPLGVIAKTARNELLSACFLYSESCHRLGGTFGVPDPLRTSSFRLLRRIRAMLVQVDKTGVAPRDFSVRGLGPGAHAVQALRCPSAPRGPGMLPAGRTLGNAMAMGEAAAPRRNAGRNTAAACAMRSMYVAEVAFDGGQYGRVHDARLLRHCRIHRLDSGFVEYEFWHLRQKGEAAEITTLPGQLGYCFENARDARLSPIALDRASTEGFRRSACRPSVAIQCQPVGDRLVCDWLSRSHQHK